MVALLLLTSTLFPLLCRPSLVTSVAPAQHDIIVEHSTGEISTNSSGEQYFGSSSDNTTNLPVEDLGNEVDTDEGVINNEFPKKYDKRMIIDDYGGDDESGDGNEQGNKDDEGVAEGGTEEGVIDEGAINEGVIDESVTDEGGIDEGFTDEGFTEEGVEPILDPDKTAEIPEEFIKQLLEKYYKKRRMVITINILSADA